MKKNQINRKCILTNEIKPTSELIRIVKTKNGEILINSEEKGRGAYISRDIKDTILIKKKRVLNRTFKTQVPNEVYDELISHMKGENKDGR